MMLLLYVRGVNEREGETKLSLDKKLLAVIEFNFLYWVNLKYKKNDILLSGLYSIQRFYIYRQFSRLERKTDTE